MSAQFNASRATSNQSSISDLGISAAERDRAQRHLQRAKDQIKMRNYNLAVQELRDAIQVDPYNSEFHALLAQVQLEKGLTGMANISLRQALKLNPEDAIALECLRKMERQKAKDIQNRQDQSGFWGNLFGSRGR
jgi:Tfp pilus assembly protein PilF